MDKRATAQGVIKFQSMHDMKPMNRLKSIPKNEDSRNFEIDRNDFPALNEISGRITNHLKNPLEYSKPFSYSEKLKKTSTGPGSSPKFEASSDVSNSSLAFVREYSVKNKNNMLRSLKMNYGKTDSESRFEVSQSSSRVSNQECSGISKIKSLDKCRQISNSERNVPRTANQKSVRAANDGQASKARNEISSENYRKVNSQMNRNTKSVMPGKTLNSQSILNRTDNFKVGDRFQNAGPSTSNKKITGSASSFQTSNPKNEGNSSQRNSNNKVVLPEQTDLHLTEVKKKKKRKSKVKRQAALQTGKILVLTPEAHSKIFSQSNSTSSKQNTNVVANINDCEEYPELGTSVVPKYNKDNTVKQVEIVSKSTSVVSNKTEVDTIKFESNLLASQPNSVIGKTEVAVLKEDRDPNAKSSDNEKAPVPVKDPITVSLFDMLLTAKSRKKEADKKNELVLQDSPLNTAKPLTKVLGRKGVSYAVNPLDSSRPAVKRGKEREKPKVKKPSRMRKLILLGRQLRKEEMTTLDESEKTDTPYGDLTDGALSPSKLIESMKDAFNQNFTCTENILLAENDYFYDKESSSDESSSGNLSSNEESQSAPIQQSSSSNYNQSFSDDCVIQTFSPTGSNETKASDIFVSKDSVNLTENDESLDEKSLNKIAHKSCSSNEPILNDFREYEEQASFNTIKSPDHLDDEEKCVLDNASGYIKTENQDFDLEMIKNISNVFDENKCSANFVPNPEDGEENKNKLLIHQSFSGCNIVNDSGSNILEESPRVNIFNSVEKETDSIFQVESSTSFTSVNNKDTSSFSRDSFNSDESPKKDENNFDQLDLNENAAGFDHLFEQMGNNISKIIISDQERSEAVKTMIHSRKFRKYCNHFISKEIDKVVFALLDDLARFQDRLHQKDPVKARVRKRLLYGIKEIKRHMKLKKLKGIILATDIEDIKTEGGLNDVIDQIISLAEAYHIPYIFSHRRFNLGKVCRKGVAVSCVGIFNYEGSEKNFKRILEMQEESKQDYIKVIKALDSVLSSNQISDVLKLGKGVPEKLYEMRTHILREHFKPDTYPSESELKVSEISTNNADDSNSNNADDSKDSNMAVFENSNLLMETNISEPYEIDKNEIYSILLKYNIV